MDAHFASCPGCGAQPSKTARFCTWCGAAFEPCPEPGSRVRHASRAGDKLLGDLEPAAALSEVFLGRDAELMALERAFQAATGGRPQLVLVSGEPGSGKSALSARFLASAAAQGAAVIRARARSSDPGSGGDLPRALVGDLAAVEPADGPERLRDRIALALGGFFPDDTRRVDLIGYLLGLAPRDSRMAGLEPKALRQAAWDVLADWIMAMARVHAVVVSVSDLHSADAASLAWLESLVWTVAQTRRDNPILVLVQHRTGAPECLPGLTAPVEATAIALKPLSEGQSWQIAIATLAGIGGSGPGMPVGPSTRIPAEPGKPPNLSQAATALVGRAISRADGNPFYLGQILRTLVESGRLACGAGRWNARAGSADVPLPASVRGAVAARLDAQEAPLRELLQVAAVAGRRFEPGVLTEVVGQDVEPGLAALIRLRYLRPLPDRRIEFAQSVVHEAALESLPVDQRRDLHRRLGLALEARHGSRSASTLAHHFALAEDAGRAARYHYVAGKQARAAYANPEAREHFVAALEWVSRSEEDADLPPTGGILLELAIVERVLGDFASAIARLDRRATIEPESPASLRARAETLYRCGELAGALQTYQTARDLAGPELVEAALAQAGAANVLRLKGDYLRAIVEAEAARADLERAGHLADAALALGVAGICHHRNGDDAEAANAHAWALRLREEAGDMEGVARSLGNLASIEAAHGRYQPALAHYARSLDILQKVGDRRAIAATLNNLGDLHLRKGDLDLAERHFNQALKVSRELGDADSAIAQLGSLAEIWLQRQNLENARRYIGECLALMERSGHAEHAAEIHAIQGRIEVLSAAGHEA